MAVIMRHASFWAAGVLVLSILALAAKGIRTARISGSSSTFSRSSGSSSVSGGVIAGIVLGTLGAGILLMVVLLLIIRYCNRRNRAAAGSATAGQVINNSSSPPGVSTVSENGSELNAWPLPANTKGDHYASPYFVTTKSSSSYSSTYLNTPITSHA